MRAHQQGAGLQVWLDFIAVSVALNFVWQKDIHQITDLCRFGQRNRLEAMADSQIVILAAGTLPDDDGATAVTQVLGLGMALASVTQNGNRFALQQGQVGIVVVVNLDRHVRTFEGERMKKLF